MNHFRLARTNGPVPFTLILMVAAGTASGFPDREVRIEAPRAEIAGTLLSPEGTNRVPCVVLVGGTLSQTRDGALLEKGVTHRNALKRLAEALAKAGYASLRYDKVGFGGSKAKAGWTGSYRDEADAVAAVVRWTREQPNLARVVVAGESAGAYLACLAAEAGTQADAYVFLGGFCGPIRELYDYNFGRLARYAATSPERAAWAAKHARQDLALGRHFEAMLAAAAEGKERFELVDGEFRLTLELARRREELRWPPDAMFRHIRSPALALAGKEDLNVPAEHAWRIARRLVEAGNNHVASLLLSACDHSFQWLPPDHDRDVAFRERYTFDSFKRGYNTGVYEALTTWLRKVIPSPAGAATAAPTTPPDQRAILKPELDPVTSSTPERLQLAPGVEIIEDLTDRKRTAGVGTLEGHIGPLLLGEGCQAHFIDLPAGMYTAEHPHGSESIIYTVRGRWVLCSQGRRHVMQPGSLFRFGAHISTGYEVPFPESACILIFKGERSTAEEEDFLLYLRGMAAMLQQAQDKGQDVFLLKDLPGDHPARQFARDIPSVPAGSNGAGQDRAGAGRREGFDSQKGGGLPLGWTAVVTGEGQPHWVVTPDPTAPSAPNVLQSASGLAKPSFALCLREGSSLQDGFVEVKFKAVRGKVDQAAGLVWRARDASNY